MTSKQRDSRMPDSYIEEEDSWEYLVPDRYKKVCTKEVYEPIHHTHTKEIW